MLNRLGQVLVVNQNGTSWSLPKGHVEQGEDLISAATREIYEESGISSLELVCLLGSYKRFKIGLDGSVDKTEQKTITMFLFRTDQDELSPMDQDNPEARWLDRSLVTGILTHRKDREFYNSVIKRISGVP